MGITNSFMTFEFIKKIFFSKGSNDHISHQTGNASYCGRRSESKWCKSQKVALVTRKGGSKNLHPQKLTWNLEMMVSNRNLLFQGSILRFHVCFGGCKQKICCSPQSGFHLDKSWTPRSSLHFQLGNFQKNF